MSASSAALASNESTEHAVHMSALLELNAIPGPADRRSNRALNNTLDPYRQACARADKRANTGIAVSASAHDLPPRSRAVTDSGLTEGRSRSTPWANS